jgi:hypothetical protein
MRQSKLLSLVIFLLFSSVILRGQGWMRTYQTPINSYPFYFNKVVETPDKGFIIAASQGGLHLVKTDENGKLIWQKRHYSESNFNVYDLIFYGKNRFIVTGNIIDTLTNTRNTGVILCFDEKGEIVWSSLRSDDKLFYPFHAKELPSGNVLVMQGVIDGRSTIDTLKFINELVELDSKGNIIRSKINRGLVIQFDTLSNKHFISHSIFYSPESKTYFQKQDSLGTIIWRKPIDNSLTVDRLFATKDNHFFCIERTVREIPADSVTQIYMSRYNTEGELIWRRLINQYDFQSLEVGTSTLTNDGGIALINWNRKTNTFSLVKHDSTAKKLWEKKILVGQGNGIYYLTQTRNNAFITVGIKNTSGLMMKMDENANFQSVIINGNIVNDQNQNCRWDSTDIRFRNRKIKIEKSNGEVFWTTSNDSGNYFVNLDTGRYNIKTIQQNLWEACTSSFNNSFLSYQTDTINFIEKPTAFCSSLEVDIAISRLRRCFTNDYNIRYCNQGTSTAAKARIEIQLDSLLEYISATRPLSIRRGQTLIFDLGDVPSLDCGSFSIKTKTRCGDSTRLGQTLCTTAKIFPDTFCSPPSNWSGANLIVSGRCDRDSVRFFVKNTSAVPTTVLKSIIVEDEIVFMRDNRSIAPNGTRIITLPANGKTWRINQEQEPNNPRNTTISAVIEGCRLGNGGFSTGFVNDFPNATGDPSVSFSCMPIVGSFDPNEKLAFPEGYKNEHFIEQNTAIDYQIGFQNTGNDTAFTVILRDTLNDNLDISTLKMGSASHKYSWDLVGKNVLTVTFNDINLVDSFKNEPASHGFVKFRINQKKDVKLGTRIENKAAIYFDFNAPIFTNKTFHVVGTSLLQVSVDDVGEDKALIKVYPNPFSNQATFELPPSVSEGIFELFDVTGKILRREKFEGNVYEFYKKELSSGIFIFKITTANGRLLGNGKIVAQ